MKARNNVFNILGSRLKGWENFTFDLDIPKLIPLSEDET